MRKKGGRLRSCLPKTTSTSHASFPPPSPYPSASSSRRHPPDPQHHLPRPTLHPWLALLLVDRIILRTACELSGLPRNTYPHTHTNTHIADDIGTPTHCSATSHGPCGMGGCGVWCPLCVGCVVWGVWGVVLWVLSRGLLGRRAWGAWRGVVAWQVVVLAAVLGGAVGGGPVGAV